MVRYIAGMIQSLIIENFRGFQSLKVEPLKGINLIAGENSTGKTAILEAIYLSLCNEVNQRGKLPAMFRSNQQGRDDFKHFWEFLFPEGELSRQPTIRAKRSTQVGPSGGSSIQTKPPAQHDWFCQLRSEAPRFL